MSCTHEILRYVCGPAGCSVLRLLCGVVQNTRYSREYATSRHHDYQSQQLHGDAAQRGLEQARDLARHPEKL